MDIPTRLRVPLSDADHVLSQAAAAAGARGHAIDGPRVSRMRDRLAWSSLTAGTADEQLQREGSRK
jgi:hypothetical protein